MVSDTLDVAPLATHEGVWILGRRILLPADCVLAFFDIEHTGSSKGGMLQQAQVWEFGSATAMYKDRSCSLIHGSAANVDSFVQCQQPAANHFIQESMSKALATKEKLATAPALDGVLKEWLQSLKATGASKGVTSVVLASHGCHAVDFKFIYWSLKRANLDPYAVMSEAGVVGVLDTTKLVKLLPEAVYNLLPPTEKAKAAAAKGGEKGGAVAKHRNGSNQALYETLVDPAHQRQTGCVKWHRARDDALANAKWVSSAHGLTALGASDGMRGALISLKQMVLMVEAKTVRE